MLVGRVAIPSALLLSRVADATEKEDRFVSRSAEGKEGDLEGSKNYLMESILEAVSACLEMRVLAEEEGTGNARREEDSS